ncbi:MAG: ribonuclease III [Chloroflexi bacterium]|uniref:Ribonuclease 3 n=1 Tax=Candidatus Chlorohelix allophototropha TaxID=3003348 RepID=A0A8T7M317_9CHLR|nr:ribonuclease III [Chloroflexota bacterium]WJW67064.1 ribonuclease III [Chloroflexota bacterium L227-S17]
MIISDDLVDLEKRLGLEFNNKALLQLALIHRSYLNEKGGMLESNERLEFLGDAILGAIVAEYLYHTFPDQSEGGLTDLRSALVRRETLAKWAATFEVGEFLLLGKGEANTGGRSRPAILSATFETILGAMYLDKGIKQVTEWLLPLVSAELQVILQENRHLNYKTRLQVEIQRLHHIAPVYELIETSGPEHHPNFVVEVKLGDQVLGRGSGTTKQQAQQEAARAALEFLEKS